jgi:kynurenine formamidase
MTARIDPHWRYHDLSAIVLENARLRLTVLPEVGAKLYDLVHKPTDRNLTLVGLDLPSVHPTDYRRVHVILFRGNVAVVEGLVRLGEVRVSRFFLVALPLPFAGLDGSPVRALAILGDPSVL